MKKNILQNIKVLIIIVVLGLGINYAVATWVGPSSTSAPGNNKVVPLNTTYADQRKGGTGQPLSGSKLDINSGTLAATNIAVWNNTTVSGDFYVNNLPCTTASCSTGPKKLCVDSAQKLTTNCTSNGPVCGNGFVETGEQCDDGNLINGDGCSSMCQIENNGPNWVPAQQLIDGIYARDPYPYMLNAFSYEWNADYAYRGNVCLGKVANTTYTFTVNWSNTVANMSFSSFPGNMQISSNSNTAQTGTVTLNPGDICGQPGSFNAFPFGQYVILRRDYRASQPTQYQSWGTWPSVNAPAACIKQTGGPTISIDSSIPICP